MLASKLIAMFCATEFIALHFGVCFVVCYELLVVSIEGEGPQDPHG